MDLGVARERMRGGNSYDEGLDLGIDGRAAHRGPPGDLGPVVAETSPLPAQDGVRGDDYQSLPPASPQPGQRDPKEPVAPAQPRPVRRSLVDGQLLPQGEVLEGELAVPAIEEGEEAKQLEQGGDHGTAIVSGSEPTDQPLVRRTRFWRRTGQAMRHGPGVIGLARSYSH